MAIHLNTYVLIVTPLHSYPCTNVLFNCLTYIKISIQPNFGFILERKSVRIDDQPTTSTYIEVSKKASWERKKHSSFKWNGVHDVCEPYESNEPEVRRCQLNAFGSLFIFSLHIINLGIDQGLSFKYFIGKACAGRFCISHQENCCVGVVVLMWLELVVLVIWWLLTVTTWYSYIVYVTHINVFICCFLFFI